MYDPKFLLLRCQGIIYNFNKAGKGEEYNIRLVLQLTEWIRR